MQTDCHNEQKAKELFHGAVIDYKAVLKKDLKKKFDNISRIVYGKMGFFDSTVLRTLERNIHWDSMLVVIDWTGSMYVFGAQVLLWSKVNFHKDKILKFVFFNDGDQIPDKEKIIGKTGGIYSSPSNHLRYVMRTMQHVMFHGNGGDEEENDIEAILFAIQHYPHFKELVLIADSQSPMRDMLMATQIQVPVRIILCGLSKKKVIHSDYLRLAYLTGGSLHTMERDIYNFRKLSEGEIVHISNGIFQFSNGNFTLLKKIN